MSRETLKCPQCSGNVTIDPQFAGQRVVCPHCGKEFLAPGVAASPNDDDDWLQLDEPADRTAGVTPAPTGLPSPTVSHPDEFATRDTGSNNPGSNNPGSNDLGFDEDEYTLAPESPRPPSRRSGSPSSQDLEPDILGHEDVVSDDFLDSTDAVPTITSIPTPSSSDPVFPGASAAAGGPSPGEDNLFADLPPVDVTPVSPQAAPVETVQEYRMKCRVCGTLMYVKPKQQGKTIKCVDCHTELTVPPPPKVRTPPPSPETAATFRFQENTLKEKPSDPFLRSADELLHEASQPEEKYGYTPPDDVPSIRAWLANVFGIFKDPSVIVHWMGLSIMLGVPAALAHSTQSKILMLGMFPWSTLVGVLAVSCGFAILNAVANEHESVTDWPTLDPVAWFEQLLLAVVAAGVSAMPAWILCKIFAAPFVLSLGFTMASVYFLFPFLVLSMLDLQSIVGFFSPEVARSATQCSEAWGGFYFSAGILFAAVFFFAMLTATTTWGIFFSIVIGIAAIFIYFSMIGRLAYAIGQTVEASQSESDLSSEQTPESHR